MIGASLRATISTVKPIWVILGIVSATLAICSIIAGALGVELSGTPASVLFGYRRFSDRLFAILFELPFGLKIPLIIRDYIVFHLVCVTAFWRAQLHHDVKKYVDWMHLDLGLSFRHIWRVAGIFVAMEYIAKGPYLYFRHVRYCVKMIPFHVRFQRKLKADAEEKSAKDAEAAASLRQNLQLGFRDFVLKAMVPMFGTPVSVILFFVWNQAVTS